MYLQKATQIICICMFVGFAIGNDDIRGLIRENEKKIQEMEKLFTTQNEMIVALNKEVSKLKIIVESKSDEINQLKETRVTERENKRRFGNVHFNYSLLNVDEYLGGLGLKRKCPCIPMHVVKCD